MLLNQYTLRSHDDRYLCVDDLHVCESERLQTINLRRQIFLDAKPNAQWLYMVLSPRLPSFYDHIASQVADQC